MEDLIYQKAVESVEDRFCRLSPCDLMALKNHELIEEVDGKRVKVFVNIQDFGNSRNIGIVASREYIIGHRNFCKGINIELSMRRMEAEEVNNLYN